MPISPTFEEELENLVGTIQVPDSKYEQAGRTYRSICDWIERPDSSLHASHQESYLQGSFRLGTAISPTTEEDDYDLDIVTVLKKAKHETSQAQLKRMLGVEVKAYSQRHGMKSPQDARRCWTQSYADGSQFHVDILPAIPDEAGQRAKLEARRLDLREVENAIAITDKKDANYEAISPNWPNSNPKGYANWFEARMGAPLLARKNAIALREGRIASSIPTYRARTPLQKAVQLLKYHRDTMFADDPEDRPISIIITTLAAKAYGGQDGLEGAITHILAGMHLGIEQELGIDWVRNPSNPMENFADKWVEYPKRKDNFYKWLGAVRADFEALRFADSTQRDRIITEAFGDEVQKKFSERRGPGSQNFAKRNKRSFLPALHRQAPPWTLQDAGEVKIYRATKSRNGYRTIPFSSDGIPLPKGTSVVFQAKTTVPLPFEVYWQIVNTGEEARLNNSLRGGFDTGSVYSGNLTHREGTKYSGTHSVECFIVKNGYLATRSRQFIVNIA
ncbi:MAG: hypothetical protein RL339_2596 [Pseudomonadota bacterium]|jgi:hypothetical protein